MSRASLLVLVVLFLLVMSVMPAAAGGITSVTSKTGSGFFYAGQTVWHSAGCPAPDGMTPEGGDSYICPPVKLPLPYPPVPRRPIRFPWPRP